MKLTRNVQIFRGQLDASPFVGVLFLLMIFLLLNSSWVFTPGIPLELPSSAGWAGATNPSVTVAIDGGGQVYFQNQLTTENALAAQLAEAAQRQLPRTMVLLADRRVPTETLVRLATLARNAGLDTRLAIRPPPNPSLPAQFP
jgi:biopolymer transport protein ExbD